ncbi:hypothetical protein AGDE_12995 [Angomonas deanei]|uniref:Uncharacterized protein n=1 Tax=Angomonas deanei TaxID=59799 RepID=A0A7G2CAN2_9TRYP|nr:hypothetical protein AGDE_12995 [Angomonas deanei]CAD2216609.1 hypothetical protein, conserved [Angomonas deanei]|eukprot:EPY23183.1 hypothetical protein AGDE_12995 [Angomonas deanei]
MAALIVTVGPVWTGVVEVVQDKVAELGIAAGEEDMITVVEQSAPVCPDGEETNRVVYATSHLLQRTVATILVKYRNKRTVVSVVLHPKVYETSEDRMVFLRVVKQMFLKQTTPGEASFPYTLFFAPHYDVDGIAPWLYGGHLFRRTRGRWYSDALGDLLEEEVLFENAFQLSGAFTGDRSSVLEGWDCSYQLTIPTSDRTEGTTATDHPFIVFDYMHCSFETPEMKGKQLHTHIMDHISPLSSTVGATICLLVPHREGSEAAVRRVVDLYKYYISAFSMHRDHIGCLVCSVEDAHGSVYDPRFHTVLLSLLVHASQPNRLFTPFRGSCDNRYHFFGDGEGMKQFEEYWSESKSGFAPLFSYSFPRDSSTRRENSICHESRLRVDKANNRILFMDGQEGSSRLFIPVPTGSALCWEQEQEQEEGETTTLREYNATKQTVKLFDMTVRIETI